LFGGLCDLGERKKATEHPRKGRKLGGNEGGPVDGNQLPHAQGYKGKVGTPLLAKMGGEVGGEDCLLMDSLTGNKNSNRKNGSENLLPREDDVKKKKWTAFSRKNEPPSCEKRK